MASIWVAYAPVGGGHAGAANAVVQAAQALGHETRLFDILDYTSRWMRETYMNAHAASMQHATDAYGKVFSRTNRRDPIGEWVRNQFDHAMFASFEKEVDRGAPDIFVSTHHVPTLLVGRLRRKRHYLGYHAVAITDYTAHAFWAEADVDRFFVGNEQVASELRAHGISGHRVRATGIPVRAPFGELPAWSAPSPHEPLRVLVSGGGLGHGPVMDVVSALASLPNVQLRVLCGRSETLLQAAREVFASSLAQGEAFGFQDAPWEHVGWSHSVVGKPGGLTLSESLAAGRPFVSVGAQPGQEAMNAEFLLRTGAGCVQNASSLAGWLKSASTSLPLMAKAAREAGKPHAARDLVQEAVAAVTAR